jgi:hypothetical protein
MKLNLHAGLVPDTPPNVYTLKHHQSRKALSIYYIANPIAFTFLSRSTRCVCTNRQSFIFAIFTSFPWRPALGAQCKGLGTLTFLVNTHLFYS